MRTSIVLDDADLAKLVTSADAQVRTAAEAAADRLGAPSRWPDLAPHVGALIVDALTEARTEGRLIYRNVAISHCRYCGAKSTWEKSKRRRREYEAKLSGVELAYRFVVISGHVSVGGCRSCFDAALPALRTELAKFPVELPQALQTDAPKYRRWDRCRCKKCEWRGHDGQLGKLPTLMPGGTYPGKCPSCGAERRPLGPDPFERLDGFDIVEAGNGEG